MILFTPIEAFKELVRSDQLVPEKIVLLNLSSFAEGFEPLRILPNSTEIYNQTGNELIVDQLLMNYILSNDDAFFEFFSKVMYPFYSGLDVVILVTNQEPFSSITESVMKIIQGRYGYNAVLINEADDFDPSYFDSNMDLNGVFNMDQDKLRYSGISAAKYGVPTDVGSLHFEDHSDTALRY